MEGGQIDKGKAEQTIASERELLSPVGGGCYCFSQFWTFGLAKMRSTTRAHWFCGT